MGELIKESSNDAALVLISLPVPSETVPPLLYMSWLDVISDIDPPVAMVRGNQSSVLTFYN